MPTTALPALPGPPSHLALPLRVAPSGPLAALPVDSPREVAQSLGLLMVTAVGERRMVELYGSIDQLGEPLADLVIDRAARDRWEERASDDLLTLLLTGRSADGRSRTITSTEPDPSGATSVYASSAGQRSSALTSEAAGA